MTTSNPSEVKSTAAKQPKKETVTPSERWGVVIQPSEVSTANVGKAKEAF